MNTSVPARPSRRSVLRGALTALAAAGVAVPALGACAARDPNPDPLEPLLADAVADADAAYAGATDFPQLTGRLATIGSVRRTHADALRAEVVRVRPDREDLLPPVPPDRAPGAAAPGRSAPRAASADAAVADLRTRLAGSSTRGAQYALRAERTRAGLAASVAGACAGAAVVLA